MDINYYIGLLKKCNENRNKTIVLTSCGYVTPKSKNLKGYMIGNKFYTVKEYNSLTEQENDTIEERIAQLDEII